MKNANLYGRIILLSILSFVMPDLSENAYATDIVVMARGSDAGGVYAHFTVLVDGEEIGNAFTTSNYAPYVFKLPVNVLTIQEIRLVFDNDGVVDGRDRNLMVQSIELDGTKYSAPGDYMTYIRGDGGEYPYDGTMWWGGELIFLTENLLTPIPYPYKSFDSDSYDLFLWEGESIVLLTRTDQLDGKVMKELISIIDGAFEFYFNATGRKPTIHPTFNYNGKTTIAEVESTCGGEGAGCGFLGWTGIELLNQYFDHLYDTYINEKLLNLIIFYELGRNFWFYGEQIEMGSSATGYAVFMEFMSIKASGLIGAQFRGRSFEEFETELRNLFNLYIADPSLNWENTIKTGEAPDNPMGLGGADLFASFMFKLMDLFGNEFNDAIWKEIDKRPDAVNEYDAADNFILASSIIAKQNLIPLFQDWKWPISQAAIEEANQLFGASLFVVNAKGSLAGGVSAHFKILVEGQEVGEAYTTSNYESYVFPLPIDPSAVQDVRVVFDNDAVIDGKDRNLSVQSIGLNGEIFPAPGVNVTYLRRDGQIIAYNGIMPWNGTLIFDIDVGPVICDSDITLSSQAEVDAIDCTKITGDLTISGPDITNLYGLSEITHIGGSLRITGNDNLTNINGLSNLKSIGESLELLDNHSLISIEGLAEIRYINSDLRISNNVSLTSLKGLQNLKSVEANLDIVGNDALLNLSNLSSLLTATYLSIKDNKNLINLDGLQSLEPESEIWIIIDGNPVLTNILALSAIRSISGLYILDNDVLTNLQGLSSLCAIGEILDITGNARLHDLDGLSSLERVGELGVHGELAIIGNESLSNINSLSSLIAIYGDLLIANNPMLCHCCGIYSLVSQEKITGYIGIANNGPGCTEADILANGPCDGAGDLIVNAKGSEADGEYAHFTIYVDGQEIGDAFTTTNYEPYVFTLHVDPSDVQEVRVVFDNDAVIAGSDRNLSVQSIEVDGMLYPAPEDNVTYVRANGSEYPYHGTMWWGGALVFNLSENDWIFSVLVGVTERTSDYYGGYENVNQLVMDQFMTINAKFNDPDVFNARLNFRVDEVYVFPGDVYSEIFKSHPDHDYKVVIDGYPDYGGGWYGSYNTIYHSWSIDSYGGPFGDTATDGLTHEWGHCRGAIDLYALKVLGTNNPVNGEDYDILLSSIMNYPYGIDVWDEHSINLINMNGGEVISNLDYIHKSFPPMIIINVQDQFEIPLNNVTINMYPVKWYSESVGSSPRLTIYTNNDGIAELIENPFEPGNSNEPWRIENCNFLIEATYNGLSQYDWLPLFEVQNHYFKYPDKPYFLNFKFSNSLQSIIVNAKGSEAGGAYAHFTVLVDDEEIGDASTATSYEPYVFPLNFAPGMIQEVRVIFDNDAVISGKDRNLYVQSVEVDGLVLMAPGENVTYIRGDGSEYPYNGAMWWRGDLVFDLSGIDRASKRSTLAGKFDSDPLHHNLKLNIYPNPTDRRFNLELVNAPIGETRLLLYDLYGNTVLDKELLVEERNALEIIDTSQFQKGIYFLKVITKDHHQLVGKILVKSR
jgi:hypothetical protein